MDTYGNIDARGKYPPEVMVWGHRLREGQHWMEYLLEFLSVLAGYGYQFGRTDEYRVPARLGLKRFVFYDEYEKTQDPRDQKAVDLLRQELEKHVTANGHQPKAVLEQLRALLRSFSVIEANRSWFAKSLFPVHEELLLWEALRKGATKNVYQAQVDSLTSAQLDAGIEFLPRNFFARGGELYYLMISAGTEQSPEQRQRIGDRLRELLVERNQMLGRFAQMVNATWQSLINEEQVVKTEPGWLPDPDCSLYRQCAEDVEHLLDNRLDALESLELLAHLIGFHIIIYIYHRAHPNHNDHIHHTGQCLNQCRPEILIDIPGDEDSRVIRQISASQLLRHEQWQSDRIRAWFRSVATVMAQHTTAAVLVDALVDQAEQFVGGVRKTARQAFQTHIAQFHQQALQLKNNTDAIIEHYSQMMYAVTEHNFRDHFLPIHRRLGRAIGLIAPQRGPQPRFVLGDTLLKTLTMTVVKPAEQAISFGEFLTRLYQRYGIIVGPGEARESGLLSRAGVNEGVFARNRERLLERLKFAGLATIYSDATAMVHRA
ncbi:hypothetical protein A6A03_17700 [Chloroflexus islandicus]|jgi:hypothetical protein|uniref:Uncharacterized protein n=1 Tax=Chloroflexus islandicus TaxID=1707952 RepID=A0A178M733_9CHLR|nr:hypothetical protein [Chloroflexus islandicus]OAN43858.1 hypothetical protein A6A03_17700 [Chloroflexus islandicus]GIV64520.1 MAG: hypothetical protein KatS3mg045_1859 [Bellilinea sp.]